MLTPPLYVVAVGNEFNKRGVVTSNSRFPKRASLLRGTDLSGIGVNMYKGPFTLVIVALLSRMTQSHTTQSNINQLLV